MKLEDMAARKYGRTLTVNMAGGKIVSVTGDGNFMPKGMEQTPFDEVTQVQRGATQQSGDPLTVAGLDSLLPQLADAMVKLAKGVTSDGFKRARRAVDSKRRAAADASARDSARNAAKASDSAWLEAAHAQDAAMGLPRQFHPAYFDKSLGLYRPVRAQ